MLGVSVAQINVLINSVLASFLVTGSVSWLYYSDRLMEFPVGVFGIALATVLLPHLSKKHTENAPKDFSRALNWGVRWVIIICIPSTVGLIILAQPIVSAIYFHGGFTENGVKMTVLSLIAYSFGLIPIVLVKVLAPGFFARQNTKTPVRIAMIAVAINIVMSLILVGPYKHVGLASATSVSAISNALMLYIMLKREGIITIEPGMIKLILKVVFATVVMCVSIWWFIGDPQWWLEISIWSRILRLGFLISLAGMSYIVLLVITGINPVSMWKIQETNQ